MAHTVRQGFEGLKSKLEITSIQGTTVSERQQRIRSIIRSNYDVCDDFLAGSYQRNTLIAPLKDADVDIFIVLDDRYSTLSPTYLLDKLKSSLIPYYPSSIVRRNGQAVTITFNDFCIDVVPAFCRGIAYFIPNSYLSNWILTDPKQHIETWKLRNAQFNGEFVRVLKMMKGWNRETGGLFSSFHLESLILSISDFVPIDSNYPSVINRLFGQLNARSDYTIRDPSGYNSNVGEYINKLGLLRQIKENVKTANELSNQAVAAESRGDGMAAYACWQRIFGRYFPTYG
jgi:predicted nucleotidyltransferase